MANGKVITGFSKPYVALYAANEGSPVYSSGMPLARGVSASADSETSDASFFYADNVAAESAAGRFTGGTLTLTVDGLKDDARKLIMGLPAPTTVEVGAGTVQVYEYDDRQEIPYVGIGFIIRYMEDGDTTYAPCVFTKATFNVDGLEAATQEEDIEFQTTELEATLMRDDSTHHTWRRIAEDQDTEADAEAVLKALLNIQESI